MKCPYCDQKMESGYITSDARTIVWRKEKYESAFVWKDSDGIQLVKKYMGVCNIKALCLREKNS